MISDYFYFAFKNLKNRKLRSSLTMLGIIIAIATIFVLISISIGLQSAVQEQFRALGTDKFFIQPKGQAGGPGAGGAVELTIKDAEIVEKVSGVKDISYFMAHSVKVEFNEQKRFMPLIGIPLDKLNVFEEVGSYKASEGRMLKKGDKNVLMIGSQYKNAIYSKPVGAGDKLLINGKEFKVQGILNPIGNPGDDRLIYMPLDNFKELFPEKNSIDQILIQINPDENIKEVAERTAKSLRSFRHLSKAEQDFSILTPEELLTSFGTFLNILTAFLVGVAAISLLVGAIGIANTMYTSVIERTKEIGIMKAVGAKNSDVLLIFVIESGILGAVGGIIGVLLGITASKTIEFIAAKQLGTALLQAAIPFYLVSGCILFAFLIGAFSGLWPAYKASKLKTVDALRYE